MSAQRITKRAMTVEELEAGMKAGRVNVLDVRGAGEWESGHLPGVPNIPLGYLQERWAELPPDGPVVVHCQSGGRSAIAISLLQARGREAINLAGGYDAWVRAGKPTELGTAVGAGA